MFDHVQGFYSDGINYRFTYIGTEGKVFESENFDIRFPNQLHSAFNWVLYMMDKAARPSPNTSPTKSAIAQKTELSEFESKVVLCLFEAENTSENFDCDLEGMQIDKL